jgi:glycine dehydrogenase subunit 1
MLDAIGISSVDELFQQIPADLHLGRELNLPEPQSELSLQQEMEVLLGNSGHPNPICFLGGGVYDHFIPAVVDEITSRGEFYTAYTPYQAEASQGTLQAFFEYQSLICRLTGMEVSNASLYEGATAVSEAVFMAMRVNGRHGNVVVAGSLHPEYLQVLQTYLHRLETEVIVIAPRDGVISAIDVAAAVNSQTCAVVMQQPNYFGCLEEIEQITQIAHQNGSLSILSFDAISPGMLKRPADYGVDIAVAEGQPLGTPLQYGGPLLGIFTCRKEFVRKMPGRLVGTTQDRNGKPCFVLNLQAREQHIRRDKATSNICTNQGLIALRTTVFLSVIGKYGLEKMAALSHQKARYAASRLTEIPGVELCFSRPFFREFAIRTPKPASELISRLAAHGINAGPALSGPGSAQIPGAENSFLLAFTEKRSVAEIDRLVQTISELLQSI